MTAQKKSLIGCWNGFSLGLRVITALAFFWALLPQAARAYIPSSRTIASRLVKTHGKGLYAVEQDVSFQTATEPVTLRERWLIQDGDTLHLSVSAAKGTPESYRFEAVYNNGKRIAPDLQGGIQNAIVSHEFIEVFQHVRSTRGFFEAMVRARIVPASFLAEPERPRISTGQGETVQYTPEPFIRLGRGAGVLTWIFGEPTPARSARANPALWIEQDAFLTRKIRFPSAAEVTANDHTEYSGSVRLPKERVVSWENNIVTIRLVDVRPRAASKSALAAFRPSSLTPAEAKAARLPDIAQVKEFYSRFR